MRYAIEFSREAEQGIDEVPEELRPAVGETIGALAKEPRPPGSEATEDEERRQLLVGECLVTYEVDDDAGVVIVCGIETGFEFTLKGRSRRATRARVVEAMRDMPPEPQASLMVDIAGTAYPVRQALSETFGVERGDISTAMAQRVFERLGFTVSKHHVAEPRRAPREQTRPKLKRPVWRPGRKDDLVTQPVRIPYILLEWWYPQTWEDLASAPEDATTIDLPPEEPGVYEVWCKGEYGRLYIGRASNLRSRVLYGLVRGNMPHTAGDKIRENENLPNLWVRWAISDRPAAVEEELHRLHVETYGRLPKYTGRG